MSYLENGVLHNDKDGHDYVVTTKPTRVGSDILNEFGEYAIFVAEGYRSDAIEERVKITWHIRVEELPDLDDSGQNLFEEPISVEPIKI
jgi:hypothetical protein